MQTTVMIVLSQLVSLAPILLVYVVGIILAAMWWRRAPGAAMLAMIGLGVLLIGNVGGMFIQASVVANRAATGAVAMGQQMAILGIALSVVRAAGTALLIAAVFKGRPRLEEGRAFEVQMSR
jgi:hypothetical protein